MCVECLKWRILKYQIKPFKKVRLCLKVHYGQLRRAISPAGKNPHPSYLWACTVFLPVSAQSTLYAKLSYITWHYRRFSP